MLPLIVTDVPTPPDVGDKLLIFGVTVKLTPLLTCPFTVTTTGPVVAPAGTAATILVALHELGVAVTKDDRQTTTGRRGAERDAERHTARW